LQAHLIEFLPGFLGPLKAPNMSKPDFENIPAKHAAALGLVVMAWADLEFDIDYTIWEMMDTPQALSACLTAQLISPIPKLNALQALLRLYQFGEKLEKRISQFSGNLGSLIEKRNRTVHDKRIISHDLTKVSRVQITAKTKLAFGPQDESFESLAGLATEISKATDNFRDIQKAIFKELDASASLPAEQKPQLPRIIRNPGRASRASGFRAPPPEPSQE
jgi:hypothetical protein